MSGAVVVRGLRDHHVHLGLVARDELATSVLSAVDDLGWILDPALDWQRAGVGGCAVRVAGPFLTAPGGYPSGRVWAPTGSVAELASPEQAESVVSELAWAGVRMIKVALHAAMPLLDDPTLRAVVKTAHASGLPVVVHAEGAGQPARALAAGVDALAHTPWSERLPGSVINGLAGGLVIISTLAIFHGSEVEAVALDNLARFHRAGGQIRYGTDLGNGPAAVDLNPVEIEALGAAGLDVPAILATICRADTFVGHEDPPPSRPAELTDWLQGLRRLEKELPC